MRGKIIDEKIEEIHIWDFPDNMYVRFPTDYRHVFFQLAFLQFTKTGTLQRILKENKLATNIIRWSGCKDRGYEQLIELKSLLFLRPYVKKRRDFLFNLYMEVRSEISNLSKKRVNKTPALIYLLRNLRYIFKGNKNFSKLLGINPRTFNCYLNSEKLKRIPVGVVETAINLLERKVVCYSFSLKELENRIVGYKSYHGKEIIPVFNNKRKLPIRITPEFESIIYHLMGDGHVAEIGSSEYTQLNGVAKKNFLSKLYNVFGYFDISEKGYNDGRVFISKTIIKLLCHYYNLNPNNFKWNKSLLPKIFFDRTDDFKIAGLVSFIVDEGYIGRSVIAVHSSNKVLLSQLRQLVLDLDLRCSEVRLKKGRGTTKDSFRFNIFKEGVKRLMFKTKELEKIYPTCNFSQKEEKVLKIVS